MFHPTIYRCALFVDKPFITIPFKSNKSYIEGTNGIICCHVESNPPIFLTTWLKNNRKLQEMKSNNNCLEFTAFQRNHAGHYTCSAENTVGKSNSSYELNILCKYVNAYVLDINMIKLKGNRKKKNKDTINNIRIF